MGIFYLTTKMGTTIGALDGLYTLNTTTGIATLVSPFSIANVQITGLAFPYSSFSVTPSLKNVTSSAGNTQFTVTSNVAWTASSNQTWCTVTPSGTGNGTITANYTANASSSIRTAIITVSVAGQSPITVNLIQNGYGLPDPAGVISGLAVVCQGQNNVTYTVPSITNATSYIWTLPNGATGTSTTNSIVVNYSSSAVSSNIKVKGSNTTGVGTESTLFITLNPLPANAGVISGLTSVCQGQNNVTYTVAPVTNAISYLWTLPNGATGTSTTNTIAVNYGASAVSGNITVKGVNSCGNGIASTLAINVVSISSLTPAYCFRDGNQPTKFYLENPSLGFFDIGLITTSWFCTGGAYVATSTYSKWFVLGDDANLYIVDTLTGNTTLVGATGAVSGEYLFGLTYDKSTNTLFAGKITAGVYPIYNFSLYTINQTTGAATLVAISPTTGIFEELACNSSGQLFTIEFSLDGSNGKLYSLNKTTAALTLIGTGFNAPLSSNYDNIDFAPNGSLYLTTKMYNAGEMDGLYTLNTTTGTATLASSFPISTLITGLAFPYSPFQLSVSPSTQNAISIAGSKQFTVTSNVAWTASSNQTWCTITPSGSGNGTITANYTANNTTSSRTALITVSGTGVNPITVTVVQSGTAIPDPAGTISGSTIVCQGQNNVVYSVPVIQYATSYIWQKPNGVFDTTSANSISINFALTAQSGILTVRGHNFLGDGVSSSLTITVNSLPATPIITQNINTLTSNANAGNQWYNLVTGSIVNATSQIYLPQQIGDYFVIVTLNGCKSDSSNIIHYNGTGIDDIESSNIFIVYPNPAFDKLFLDLYQIKDFKNTNILIYNVQGQLLLQQVITNTQTELNIEKFAKGVYVIKINNERNTMIGKFIKE